MKYIFFLIIFLSTQSESQTVVDYGFGKSSFIVERNIPKYIGTTLHYTIGKLNYIADLSPNSKIQQFNLDFGKFKLFNERSKNNIFGLDYKFDKLKLYYRLNNNKHFIEIKDDNIEAKSIINQYYYIQLKNARIAYGNKQVYTQYNNNISYKVLYENKKVAYNVNYKGFGLSNNGITGALKIGKLNLKLSSKNGIDSADYVFNIKDNYLSVKYTNQYSLHDFYFNPLAFDIYNNNQPLFNVNNTLIKRSAIVEWKNHKCNLNMDLINHVYAISFNVNAQLSVGIFTDQHRSIFTLINTYKYGSAALEYNLVTNKFDALKVEYVFKF